MSGLPPHLQRLARRLHRAITPIILLPVLLTAFTGTLHPLLRSLGLSKQQVGWLLKIHSGNFIVINLKPVYPVLLGISTMTLAVSGLLLYLRAGRLPRSAEG